MASWICSCVHGVPQSTGQPVVPNCSRSAAAGWSNAGPVGYIKPIKLVNLLWVDDSILAGCCLFCTVVVPCFCFVLGFGVVALLDGSNCPVSVVCVSFCCRRITFVAVCRTPVALLGALGFRGSFGSPDTGVTGVLGRICGHLEDLST